MTFPRTSTDTTARSRRRRAIISLAAGVVTVGLVSGCTVTLIPQDAEPTSIDLVSASPTNTGPASIPPGWPADVPLFEAGDLVDGADDGFGGLSATWTTTGSAADVGDAYGSLLEAAGFTSGEPYVDDTTYLTDFTKGDLAVNVYVLTTDAEASLTVSVVSTTDPSTAG